MMKKLILVAFAASVTTTVMAAPSSYCPSDLAATKNAQGFFVANGPNGTVFIEKFHSSKKTHATVGPLNMVSDYLPAYNNQYGQIACNYKNATLWLEKPTQNATVDKSSTWSTAGNNALMCNSAGIPINCKFFVGTPAKK